MKLHTALGVVEANAEVVRAREPSEPPFMGLTVGV